LGQTPWLVEVHQQSREPVEGLRHILLYLDDGQALGSRSERLRRLWQAKILETVALACGRCGLPFSK